MDITRANEILHSSETIEVLHQGEPVWIDSIDEKKGIATVHKRKSGTKEMYQVPIDQLKEVQ